MEITKENIPNNWRKGQTLFNFLEWLRVIKNVPSHQSKRMGDTFHIPDEKLEELWEEYLKIRREENEL